MGMHLGLIAAKTSIVQFRDAFLRAMPNYELASAENLHGNALEAWRTSHEHEVIAADWRQRPRAANSAQNSWDFGFSSTYSRANCTTFSFGSLSRSAG